MIEFHFSFLLNASESNIYHPVIYKWLIVSVTLLLMQNVITAFVFMSFQMYSDQIKFPHLAFTLTTAQITKQPQDKETRGALNVSMFQIVFLVVTSNLGKSPEGVSGKQFNRPVVAKLLSSSALTRILHQPHTHTQTISDETNSQLQGVPKNEVLNRNQDDLRGTLSNNFKLDWVGKRGAIILDHLSICCLHHHLLRFLVTCRSS